MELRQVRCFVVICEEGSLTRAGARMHLAQQSLSQMVAALEAQLGVTLLQRGAFGVRPTAAGRVLCEQGAALLREADGVTRAVQRAGPLGAGAVSVRYGLDSEHLVGPLIAALADALPEVAVTGWTGADSANLAAVRDGQADLAFAWAVAGAADVEVLAVATETTWAAVPDGHPLTGLPAVPVAALAGLPVVMFPRQAAPGVWDHIAGCFTADGRLSPRFVETPTSGQPGMVDAAVRTGAIAPVSRSLAASLHRPDVRFVPFAPEVTVPLHLVWRPPPAPATTAVIAAVEELTDRGGATGTGR